MTDLALSADGRYVAAITESKRNLVVIERQTGHIVKEFTVPARYIGVALSPTGDTVAYFDLKRRKVALVEVTSGRERALYDTGGLMADVVRFAPDGSALAADGAGGATVWSTSTGEILLQVNNSEANAKAVTYTYDAEFSPTGRAIAVAIGRAVRIYALPQRSEEGAIPRD